MRATHPHHYLRPNKHLMTMTATTSDDEMILYRSSIYLSGISCESRLACVDDFLDDFDYT